MELGSSSAGWSILGSLRDAKPPGARFDCDLSLDVNRPLFKRNNLRFNEQTHFQRGMRLPEQMRKQIQQETGKVDRDTIMGGVPPGGSSQ